MANKKSLKTIAEENEKFVENGIFMNKPTSGKYNLSFKFEVPKTSQNNNNSQLIFFNGYTDGAIVYNSKLNKKMCALNFANAFTPGGGYLKGARAQEEDLCRQYPTLHTTLHEMKTKYNQYPLKFCEMIYSSEVARYRNDAQSNYTRVEGLPTVFCDFITAACPNMRNRSFSEIKQIEYDHIIKSIDLMFKIAISADVKIFILGAWGCGAFSPIDNVSPTFTYTNFIANEFKKASNKYLSHFDAIVFAVPDDENGKIFRKVFTKN